jgi:hypothetical protein
MTQPFKPIKVLIACYIGLSALGFAAAVLLRDQPQLVNTAVWVRSSIVLVTSVLTYLFAERASRGDRRSLLRLRVVTIVVPLVIVGLIVLPDPFPVWMKVQQGLCGLVLAGAAILAVRPSVSRELAAYRDTRHDASRSA